MYAKHTSMSMDTGALSVLEIIVDLVLRIKNTSQNMSYGKQCQILYNTYMAYSKPLPYLGLLPKEPEFVLGLRH